MTTRVRPSNTSISAIQHTAVSVNVLTCF